MRRHIVLSILLLASMVAFELSAGNPPATQAQTGGGYDLTWSTIDGGGGTSTGGTYSLSGTIGQPATDAVSGGVYTLAGGFWPAAGPTGGGPVPWLYLPLIRR